MDWPGTCSLVERNLLLAVAKLIKCRPAINTIRDLRRINLSRKCNPNGLCIRQRLSLYLDGYCMLLCGHLDGFLVGRGCLSSADPQGLRFSCTWGMWENYQGRVGQSTLMCSQLSQGPGSRQGMEHFFTVTSFVLFKASSQWSSFVPPSSSLKVTLGAGISVYRGKLFSLNILNSLRSLRAIM